MVFWKINENVVIWLLQQVLLITVTVVYLEIVLFFTAEHRTKHILCVIKKITKYRTAVLYSCDRCWQNRIVSQKCENTIYLFNTNTDLLGGSYVLKNIASVFGRRHGRAGRNRL